VRVYLGSDHAGFELKAAIISWLKEAGHEAVDCGPASYDPGDDYPPYVMRAAKGTIDDPGSLGIVIGGSGNGEQIAANKIPGIRAALAWTVETARLARQHNDANVLSLGAREYSTEDGVSFVKVFLETPFSGEPRHARRIAMIADFEETGELPVLFAGAASAPRGGTLPCTPRHGRASPPVTPTGRGAKTARPRAAAGLQLLPKKWSMEPDSALRLALREAKAKLLSCRCGTSPPVGRRG
jgi:ribose 5-phosphate isomerase B